MVEANQQGAAPNERAWRERAGLGTLLAAQALDLAGSDPDPTVPERLGRALRASAPPTGEAVLEVAWNAGLSPASMRRLLSACAGPAA